MKAVILTLLTISTIFTLGCSDSKGGKGKAKPAETPATQAAPGEIPTTPVTEPTDISEDQALVECGVAKEIKAVYEIAEVTKDLEAFQKAINDLITIGYSIEVDEVGCDDFCSPDQSKVNVGWSEVVYEDYADNAETPTELKKTRAALIKVSTLAKTLLNKYGAGYKLNSDPNNSKFLKVRTYGQLLVYKELTNNTLALSQKDHFKNDSIYSTTADQVQFNVEGEANFETNGRPYPSF